jgi:transcriptional regulator with XRE-family HTH domain
VVAEPLTLGEYLRELRDHHDLSLRELGAKTHVSAAFLSDIELGRRYPSPKVLALLAKALGTTIEDLSQHDNRPPMEELRRLANANPSYAIALRRFAERPEELLKIANKTNA